MPLANPAKTKITHVLRDGTVLDSIEGHVVQFEDAEPLYRLMHRINAGHETKQTNIERRST